MIRVWCVDLRDGDERIFRALYEQATPERKLRADRYRRREDQLRCVAADALLRRALGTEQYRTERGEAGKPRIVGHPEFHYNLSHSGRYVVLAWGKTPVGVDVQRHESTVSMEVVARTVFAPEEQHYIRTGNPVDPLRFYEIWTKKESFLKYTGQGFRGRPGTFSVLTPEPEIRFFQPVLQEGYSLSLCTTEDAFTLELLEIRQLG